MPAKQRYNHKVKKVLTYLSKVTVATSDKIIENTGIKSHDIRRMVGDSTLTSSLNYKHRWLISTKTIRKKKDRKGFYRHRIKKYSRTVPVFHSKRKTKATLSFIASKNPWGITAGEARELLGRKCKRALNDLVDVNSIQARIIDNQRIFLNRYHKKAKMQIKHRLTNPRLKKDGKEDEEKDEKEAEGIVSYEEFCKVFKQIVSEMYDIPDVSKERMSLILMMHMTNRSLRTTENWIKYNQRIQNAVGITKPIDHTTISRSGNEIDTDFLKKLFHKLVSKLSEKGIITNRFLAVDATHIYAYADTSKNTDKHPVEGASWGDHHGSFYGYKVHILVDTDSELPIGMCISEGKDHDSQYFVPLVKEYDREHEYDDIRAMLADSAYDNENFRDFFQKTTGGLFLPACNPRRSKIRKTMKKMVKRLFDRHGNKIKSVQDGFKYLTQRFLTDFGIDIGSDRESKITELIAERLHRPFRASVERFFSRMKAFSSFEKPKTKEYPTVVKGVWWCLIGHLVQAITADKLGIPGSMRKLTSLA